MFNALTAFSAHNYYIGMYYAFLRILCLTFAPFVYLLLDQDVSMDASKYVKDNDQRPEAKYDALRQVDTIGEILKFSFDREEHLRSIGASVNGDGSTNHLPDYYNYNREIKKSFLKYAIIYFIWSVAVGFYAVLHVRTAMHGVVNSSGETFDIMNGWLPLYYNIALTCYVMMILDTRNITPLTVLLYALTMGALPLVAWMADTSGDFYYGWV